MNATRIQELEQLIAKAHTLRTQANRLKVNRQFVFVINSNIRDWNSELNDLVKVGA